MNAASNRSRMRLRTAAPLAALVVATGLAVPSHAAPPVTGTYDVVIPVPHPVEDGGVHCNQGLDDLTRHTQSVTLPRAGVLDVKVSGFLGDWVVEVYDAKGRVLAYGASLDLQSGVREAKWKKKKAGAEKVSIVVCNFGGTPAGKVAYRFA